MSKEIDRIEKYVDNYYKQNPLVALPFSTSSFYVLLMHEEIFRMRMFSQKSSLPLHEELGMIDFAKFAAKYSLAWLRLENNTKFKHIYEVNESTCIHAAELFSLGKKYMDVVPMFTYFRRGYASADILGPYSIRFTRDHRELSYNVLDYQLKAEEDSEKLDAFNIMRSFKYLEPIQRVCLKNARKAGSHAITYSLREIKGRILERLGMDLLQISPLFLPNEWSIFGITTSMLRRMMAALNALCYIHAICNPECAKKLRVEYAALASSVMVRPISDWVRSITRISGVSKDAVSEFVKVLTYDLKDPKRDIATQPFCPLDEQYLAVAPFLIIGSSFERNFVSLLARRYKNEYDRTTAIYEKDMMTDIVSTVAGKPFLYSTNKSIAGAEELPDIDLVLFDSQAMHILIVELKWVIEPSETYEIIERSGAERKGISQIDKILNFANSDAPRFFRACFSVPVPSNTFTISGIVVMKGFVGTHWHYRENIPVIPYSIFTKKVAEAIDLKILSEWLIQRPFMPAEGRDFTSEDLTVRIGDASLSWEGYKFSD